MATSNAPHLLIGYLAKRTGCKVETIRYYEHIGVLPAPERSASGQRRYTTGQLKRLNFVRRARDLGFNLRQVRDLLRLADDRNRTCAEVEEMARAHHADVQAIIADLRRLESVLTDMVAQCTGDAVPECPIIDALFGGPPCEATQRDLGGREGEH